MVVLVFDLCVNYRWGISGKGCNDRELREEELPLLSRLTYQISPGHINVEMYLV